MDNDFIKRFSRLEEQLRRDRTRRKGHAETKTFLAEGAIEAGRYIGPFFTGVDLDGYTPEWKVIFGFQGVIRVGQCTVQWLLNGLQVGDDHLITATVNEHPVVLDDVVDLASGDIIQPSISAASVDAADLAAAVFMITAAA
jgi:hypothetical protein